MSTTIAKHRPAKATEAKAFRSPMKAISTLSKRVDSLDSELAFFRDKLKGLRVVDIGLLEKINAKVSAGTEVAENRSFMVEVWCAEKGHTSVVMGSGKEDAAKRPSGYACDPDSPEFTDVLMKCFADGKRKALEEAKQKASARKAK